MTPSDKRCQIVHMVLRPPWCQDSWSVMIVQMEMSLEGARKIANVNANCKEGGLDDNCPL